MNYKKIFLIKMMVALAATMSVGITSCKEDLPQIKPDYTERLIGIWRFTPIDFPVGYTIEFTSEGTYSYENPEQGSGSGNYKIIKTIENQEVRVGDRIGEPKKATLLIIEVTPDDTFDQIWVYYINEQKQIAVDYYSKNIRKTGNLYVLSRIWWPI